MLSPYYLYYEVLTLLPYLIITYEVRGEKVTKCMKDFIKLVKQLKC